MANHYRMYFGAYNRICKAITDILQLLLSNGWVSQPGNRTIDARGYVTTCPGKTEEPNERNIRAGIFPNV